MARLDPDKSDECKFCLRNFVTCDNPIIERRADHPTLERWKNNSVECKTCHHCVTLPPWGEYNAKNLVNKFNSDASFQRQFKESVEQYEAERNTAGFNKKRARGLTYNKDSAEKTSISAVQEDVLEATQNLGVFWPLELVTKHHPDLKWSKKDLVSCPGVAKKGLVLEASFGNPIGTRNLAKVAARVLATYFIPGCVGRGVRLGSENSSGAGGGAAGGVQNP